MRIYEESTKHKVFLLSIRKSAQPSYRSSFAAREMASADKPTIQHAVPTTDRSGLGSESQFSGKYNNTRLGRISQLSERVRKSLLGLFV